MDPIKMVIVNVICSIALLVSIILFTYKYPKKKINLFFILILISLLPLTSLLRPGTYESGDFNIHIYRVMTFYQSLHEGWIAPSWAGELNATYGYPLFIFNYPLPYYIVSLFHWIGFTFISGLKLYLGLSLFLSGIFIYIWIKNITGNKLAAFTSAIFYVFNPYHLIDVHFRATVGESTVFTLVPLLFNMLTLYAKKKLFIYLVLSSLFTALLFLAHTLLAGIFAAIGIIYCIFQYILKRKCKQMLLSIGSIFIGIIISIYSWIPFIIYTPYTLQQHTLSGQWNDFYPFNLLFYSPWKYGLLFQGPHGELALIIGYTQSLVVGSLVILLICKKIPRNLFYPIIFWIVLFIITLAGMRPSSAIVWKYFALLTSLLPTGRLCLVLSFCTSILAGFFVMTYLHYKHNKKIIYLLIIVTIGLSILNWGQRRVIPTIGDRELRNNVWISTATGEGHFYANSIFRSPQKPWFNKKPIDHLETIKGKTTIKELTRTSTDHIYVVNVELTSQMRENTLYFPGWNIYSDYKLVSIHHDNQGVITFTLPKGVHYVEIVYKDIAIYRVFKAASAFGFICLFVYLLVYAVLVFKNSRRS